MTSLLIALLVLLAAGALEVQSRRGADNSEQSTWVKWGSGLKLVAAFGVAVMVKIVLDGVAEGAVTRGVIAAAIYGLLAVPLFANAFFWRVGFGDYGLDCRSAWRARRSLPWDQITGVSFSKAMRQWKILTATQGIIRINELATGSSRLIAELQKRGFTIPERYEPVRE